MTKRKNGWYGVDLDATLANYVGYKKEIGEPIPIMVRRVKLWLAIGRTVKVFTARVSKPTEDETIAEIRKRIEDWCEKHIGQKLEVTNIKDHDLIEFWDDKAVRVEKNTGKRIG